MEARPERSMFVALMEVFIVMKTMSSPSSVNQTGNGVRAPVGPHRGEFAGPCAVQQESANLARSHSFHSSDSNCWRY